LIKIGCNCAPNAIAKEDLSLTEFSRQPEKFYAFLQGVMGETNSNGEVA
jgi:hypothetical protein